MMRFNHSTSRKNMKKNQAPFSHSVVWGLLSVSAAFAGGSVQAQDASSGKKQGEAKVAVIRHDKVRAIDLDCSKRQIPAAKISGKSSLDQEALLLAAVKDKPFPKSPLQSLGWMDLGLKTLGFQGSLTSLKGPSQMAAIRLPAWPTTITPSLHKWPTGSTPAKAFSPPLILKPSVASSWP